ncbi:MAG: type II toxin-antitoxin system HicB family antitoxin [Thermomicrobiales bacterium]
MKEYLVVVHHAEEGGYWAEVPALDGCFAQGETVEDVLSDARGAIASHLAALRDDGQSLPGEGGILIATVTLPAA